MWGRPPLCPQACLTFSFRLLWVPHGHTAAQRHCWWYSPHRHIDIQNIYWIHCVYESRNSITHNAGDKKYPKLGNSSCRWYTSSSLTVYFFTLCLCIWDSTSYSSLLKDNFTSQHRGQVDTELYFQYLLCAFPLWTTSLHCTCVGLQLWVVHRRQKWVKW